MKGKKLVIEIYQICKESLKTEEKFIKNKELIYLLETQEFKKVLLNKYADVNLNTFLNKFRKKVVSFFPELLNHEHIIGYIVPAYIKGNDKICDGFAYISQSPRIVVSNYTDVLSVFCHEFCHLIVYNVVGKECMVWGKGEILVELVEFILCKDVLPPIYLPTNQEIITFFGQYEKSGATLEEFLSQFMKK